jgi:hypothetical protein
VDRCGGGPRRHPRTLSAMLEISDVALLEKVDP